VAPDWGAAAAAIGAAFAEREPIVYTRGGVVLPPIPAIRSDVPAPTFEGPGRTLRTVSYEIRQSDLPARPANGETFTHRGRRWRVGDVTTLDDVGAWSVVVTDSGVAS